MLLYWKLARGRMGEEGAARESIACKQHAKLDFHVDDNLRIRNDIVHLNSFCSDNLICVHSNPSEYNNCKNGHTLGEALMIKCKGINGEMSIGC